MAREASAARPTPRPESLTEYVSGFAAALKLEDVPEDVTHHGKRSVLDGLGLALAGAVSQASRIVRQHLQSLGCAPGNGATLLGSSLRMAPRFAAFANGISIHADDYDDTQLAVAKDRVYGLLTHPTAPTLPAVLALGETHGHSGREVLQAYLVAVEVETKISEAIHPRHYQHGFHSTATCGAIGAAAGAANLLGFDIPTTRRALGLAASQAGGLRENFGTMTKPFHAGRAAESGLLAADLASRGFTAAPTALEADRGFFRAAGGGYDAEMIEGKLGQPWTFASPGVSIKPHPSGSLTHPGMGLMLDLIRRHDIQAQDVRRVAIGTNQNMPNALIHHHPTNELQAKFSMEFCMAILLLERRAGLAEFTDEVVNRPDVQALIDRIDFGVHPEAEAAGYEKMTTIIDIELANGDRIHGRADYGKGSPANPMTDDELADKFRECAAWGGLSPADTERALDLIWHFEEQADLGELLRVLGRAATPA
ncbi:MAG TPA: MmgE/PrpD family protein [Trueperaceae bacterium]